MSSSRVIAGSLVVGVLHAACLLAVALALGYPIEPAAYSPLGVLWRYGGLVVVASLPAWLAGRFGLITPMFAVTLTAGYVLGMELTPPGPTFHDVTELERLSEPTGLIVVENGLYIVRYMLNASVWTVGFLFAGTVEGVCRTSWARLPGLRTTPSWLLSPISRRQALVVAAVGGILHMGVMVWFAARLGVTVSGQSAWTVYTFGAVGMWILAAGPLYALLRQRLIAPAVLLTGAILLDVQAEFTPGAGDPHALYFGAWFFYLAIFLVAGSIEYLLRELSHRLS